jgi:hypothetical protein
MLEFIAQKRPPVESVFIGVHPWLTAFDCRVQKLRAEQTSLTPARERVYVTFQNYGSRSN